jgi:hypothetical protein
MNIFDRARKYASGAESLKNFMKQFATVSRNISSFIQHVMPLFQVSSVVKISSLQHYHVQQFQLSGSSKYIETVYLLFFFNGIQQYWSFSCMEFHWLVLMFVDSNTTQQKSFAFDGCSLGHSIHFSATTMMTPVP